MTASLLVSRTDACVDMTLNRPEKLNALDGDLVEALIAALRDASGSGARLVVLRGEGKAFSAGFDLSDLESQSEGDLALRFLRLEMLLQTVYAAPFVTLALVHGFCYGAAADLVAVCTHRIAAPDARFRMPGLRFGIALGTRRLGEIVGRDAARALLVQSRTFDAETALRLGFLTGIAEVEDWPARVDEVRQAAQTLSPASLERLLRLTREDRRDADLAELARSVAEPGLKARIAAYLAELAAARSGLTPRE